MSLKMRAVTALAEFGESIGFDGFELDATGFAVLAFDDVLVNFELDEDRQQLLLTATLGKPHGNKHSAYEHLMDANFCWQGTYGGTFSLERETGEIILQRPLPLTSLDRAALEKALQEFVDTTEAWTKQLAAGTTESPSDRLRFGMEGMIRA